MKTFLITCIVLLCIAIVGNGMMLASSMKLNELDKDNPLITNTSLQQYVYNQPKTLVTSIMLDLTCILNVVDAIKQEYELLVLDGFKSASVMHKMLINKKEGFIVLLHQTCSIKFAQEISMNGKKYQVYSFKRLYTNYENLDKDFANMEFGKTINVHILLDSA